MIAMIQKTSYDSLSNDDFYDKNPRIFKEKTKEPM